MDNKTNNNLRIVFMGTPEFAVESLKALIDNNYNVVGVITTPDKPQGRGQKIRQSDVKKYALSKKLTVLQPENLKDSGFVEELKSLNADIQVVVAFRMLPKIVWNMPPLGTFNLHASLLPHYRGAAPINRVIMDGEKETGVTTFFIEQKIDTGNIIFREKVEISDTDTAGELHDKLMTVGASLVIKTLSTIDQGNCPGIKQTSLIAENEKIKQAPKIFKKDCQVAWNMETHHIYNHIRGLNPYPTAWTLLVNTMSEEKISVKIFDVSIVSDKPTGKPGLIQTDRKSYIHIATIDGYISIKSLQLAGKKRLQTANFLRGFDITNYHFA